jgi:hypothetical protein
MGENEVQILTCLNDYYNLTQDSIHHPDEYLGTKIKQTALPNVTCAWGQSRSQYVLNTVKNPEAWMSEKRYRLTRKASTPMLTS